ncbi:DUF11 domain-containing protein [Leptolyngbya sp. FACHB-261]|uniref:DUF11 domain-containing protein n=1 Tax=Leptolyngbya sp. FACHB-261 TaxID=2692806 RepID=UPI00168344CE|nr:DUF11 domain-containing protein [Leptolyngbya sp. FACHB-261]MBD2101590.1 DUF11 domain-containing protein [Leptolyngbya sp. FACHB-261]
MNSFLQPFFIVAGFRLRHLSWIGSLLLVAWAWSQWAQPAQAEGSREIVSGGGARPLTEWRPREPTSGVPRRTILQVFAQAGEVINLGSSAVGIGNGGNAVVFAPSTSFDNAQVVLDCRRQQPGQGLITSRAQELAGPLPAAGGYTPCTYTAPTAGIYQVAFYGPAGPNAVGNGTPTRQINDVPGNFNTSQRNGVALWDITVFSNGTPRPGRVFSNYLALYTGANGPGAQINSNLFIQTRDGFTYRVNTNNLDPDGAIFFSNNRGFIDANNNGLYRSINLDAPAGATFQSPAAPDQPGNATNKIFFNQPDPLAVAAINGFSTFPILPLAPTNFLFRGIEGTPGQTGSVPLRGTFSFLNPNPTPGSYTISIDINRNGSYRDPIDRILTGTAQPGNILVEWDGRDGQGNPVPAGTAGFGAQVTINAGEAHFPLLDSEGSGGLIIQRTSPLGADADRVYYNDAGLATGGGPPNPLSLLQGGNSSSGNVHAYGNGTGEGFGDRKGIDTWTYLPSTPIPLQGNLVIAAADLVISKTHSPNPVTVGTNITYTITVRNNGPSNVNGVTVTDTIPPEVTGVRLVSCTPQGPQGSAACLNATINGNTLNSTVRLNNGSAVVYTITGLVSAIPSSGRLINTATVQRPNDVADPVDQDNSGGTNRTESAIDEAVVIASPVSPTGLKSVRLFTDVDNSGSLTTGDIVEYTVVYINTTNTAVNNVLITDPLNTNLLQFVAGSYSYEAFGTGTTVQANANYNGTSDPNLTSPSTRGTLAAGGGRVVIRFRAVVTAGSGVQVINQASATSDGPVSPSLTDALTNTGDIAQLLDDGINQGNLPGTGDDDPTLLVVAAPGPPRFRLVKRVTAVFRENRRIAFNGLNEDASDPDDNAPGWSQLPTPGLAGAFSVGDANSLSSGDQIEYTIYFLSDGASPSPGVNLCDPIPTGTTYLTNGPAGGEIQLNRAGTNTVLTSNADSDAGRFVPRLNPVGSPCPNSNNPNGAILVNLGDVPNQGGANFGFIRFRVRVD